MIIFAKQIVSPITTTNDFSPCSIHNAISTWLLSAGDARTGPGKFTGLQ